MIHREFTKTSFNQTPTEQFALLVDSVFRHGKKVDDPISVDSLSFGDVLIPASNKQQLFSRAVVVNQLTDKVADFDPDDTYLNDPFYQYTIKSAFNPDNGQSIHHALSLRTVFSKKCGLIHQAAVKSFGETVWINLPHHAIITQIQIK